jgi:hypothetical protein
LDKDRFPYPIFLTIWHMLMTSILTRILKDNSNLLPAAQNLSMTWNSWSKGILPIGVFYSVSLIFNNYAYLTLSVSFIQVRLIILTFFYLPIFCAYCI